MKTVRIVGGGLIGVLAALEAHRLGCRDIHLHRTSGAPDAGSSPPSRDGVELQSEPLMFGPRGEPTRSLLEWHGLAFEDALDLRLSVNPGARNAPAFHEAAGPVLPCPLPYAAHPLGASLAARLRAYPPAVAAPLARYCRWRIPAWLDRVDARAAPLFGLSHVYPLGASLAGLAQAKARDPLIDTLYGLPDEPPRPASIPRDSLAGFHAACRRALFGLGVSLDEHPLPPLSAVAAANQGEVVVWTASPAPLLAAFGLPQPPLLSLAVTRHHFRARWTGAAPLQLDNFTARGVIARLRLYRSRGEPVLCVESLGDARESDLRREAAGLFAGFPGDLAVGERLAAIPATERAWLTTEAVGALKGLRRAMSSRAGPGLVAGGWEETSLSARHQSLSAELRGALGAERAAA